jgi:hypothetical protein
MFAELLKKKEEMLQRLLPVSQRQLELVRRENVSDLLQHLGQKSKLLDELEALEKQLVPFKEIPVEQRTWKNETERSTAQTALEHCNELLKQIITLETQSTEEHAAQKVTVERELYRSRQAGQIHNAYFRNGKDDGNQFQAES